METTERAVPPDPAELPPDETAHVDDITGATAPSSAGWQVETLAHATWAIRRLRHLRVARQAFADHAAREIARITAWRDGQTRALDRDIETVEHLLTAYHARLIAEDPHTPATLRLPGGVVTRRRLPDALAIPDEDAALAAVRRAGWEDAVRTRTVETLDRRALLARIKATGEVLPEVGLRAESYAHTVRLDDEEEGQIDGTHIR